MNHQHNAGCRINRILEISETCDNEYYLSALGPPEQNRARAKRGLRRMKECLEELKEFQVYLSCEACLVEIQRQLEIQNQAIIEICRIWEFPA